MAYSFSNGKIITNGIEYSVAYHCNLRCTQCSHLSPFMEKVFPAIDSFEKDMFRLSEVMRAKVIRLLGGEPLLNPEIDQFLVIARKSNIADRVMVTTNGLLLHRMSSHFWRNADDVLVSLYPGVELKEGFIKLKQRAQENKTRLWFRFINHFQTKVVTKPHQKNWMTSLIYRTCRDCHLHHCHMVHEGVIYKCPLPPFLKYYLGRFNKDYDPYPDGLVIDGQIDLVKSLRKYLINKNALEACRYCLGELGKPIPHVQLSESDKEGVINGIAAGKGTIDPRRILKVCCDYLHTRHTGLFY